MLLSKEGRTSRSWMSLPVAMVTGCEFHPPGGQQALDSPSVQLAARMKEMLCMQMPSTVDGRASSPLGQLQWPQGKVAQPGPTSCCIALGTPFTCWDWESKCVLSKEV